MNDSVSIFLGANSGEGFFSLYDQLLNARFDDLLLIKGGPGCGKSSFMRAVAKELAKEEGNIIYVNCSGDPDSLDGVLIPSLKIGLVDATSPHVLEPTYTVANERYVDLTKFYDVAGTKAAREEIVAHSDAYRAAYASAYRILRAVRELSDERRAAVFAAMDFDKLARRVDGILRREVRGAAEKRGRVDYAFLGGTTCRGELCRFETVDALCPRVYELADSWGLAGAELGRICDAAADAGCDVLACPDPLRPKELRHVLIPSRGLAFVTSSARLPYPGKAYRRLRLDALAEGALTRAGRAKLRFTGRLERALRDEAAEALARAKAEHDALERAYNPFVDFDGVYALAAAESERLRGYFCKNNKSV
ncbi:MAG: hypothetical protein E7422_05145 [Ruminococcaceae bacterium]|nr:hypothetical protein [Oscillospiraceae bacterium]